MKILNFKDFMKKNIIKKSKYESELRITYKYPIYPRGSKFYSDRGFVNIDNGSQCGIHWTCFLVKITNHTAFTLLAVSRKNFNLFNYLNQ